MVYTYLIMLSFKIQEGNTPYSLALSGSNQELTEFVMTYAANLPQKEEIPSQMTIFDLNGGVDIVDFSNQRDEDKREDKNQEEDISAYDEVSPKQTTPPLGML